MNAADESQVKHSERKGRNQKEIRLAALRGVLSTKAGRDVMWWLLEEAGVHKSVFSVDSNTMAFRAGWQDYGHFLEAQIAEADEEALFQMMRDARNAANPPAKPDEKGEANA